MAIFLTLAGAASAYVVEYHVDPVRAQWSGWTGIGDTLSQSVTCSFDSLVYVELFAGELGAGSQYVVTVFDDAKELTRSSGMQMRSHVWVKFENWNTRVEYTKGKEYEFRFTRSGGDSLQYYYQSGNPYPYGLLIDPSLHDPAPLTWDLAMRCYGRMKPVSDVWRACVNHGNWPPPGNGGNEALERAESIGIKWLRDDFGKWEGWEDDTQPAMGIYHRYENRFCMTGILCYGSNDSAVTSCSPGDSPSTWCMHPPRNLFLGLTDTNNYWAGYCRSIMGSMPKVKYWEVWPEANTHWFWQDPDTAYYQGSSDLTNDLIDTPRERCSLYVRMCQIAESVAHALGGDPRRKILGGTPWRMFEWDVDSIGDTIVASGASWLGHMFDLAEHRYGGVENCFDIVSVHPYMFYDLEANDILHFIEDTFRINLDTARAVMRAAGYPGMELWATEYGWPRWDGRDKNPLTDTLMQADNLCKFYASAVARQTDPCGGYDRAIWYELTAFRPDTQQVRITEGFGLLDTNADQTRLPHSWAFSQVNEELSGKRCNGRVMDGDTAVDNHVRMYEFENPASLERTWVCWKNGNVQQDIAARLPVRTNSLAAESLAYTETPPAFSPRVADDGWLHTNLDTRPVFISEDGTPLRPDLKVDSVQFVQSINAVRAWVTNHGSRATPVRSGSRVPYPTWAVLRADGDSLAQQVRATSIAADQQVKFTFDLGQTQLPDTALLGITVNPNQTYVELGTDDNTGYTLAIKP